MMVELFLGQSMLCGEVFVNRGIPMFVDALVQLCRAVADMIHIRRRISLKSVHNAMSFDRETWLF